MSPAVAETSAWVGAGPTLPSPAETRQLLVDYAVHVAGLAINPDAKRIRRRNARVLTDAHPDLWAWLGRPTTARLADLRRSHAWPLICWAWVNGGCRSIWT
jgi:hypothetical protein